jgi:hypothetical protein
MKACVAAAMMLMATAAATTQAAPPRLAAFDFEWIDTSLEGEVNGPRPDEHARLIKASVQLRQELAQSARFDLIDMADLVVAARSRNLQACGGCDVDLARQAGADLVLTGVVQKVSNLILNMNLYLRNAHTGQLVKAMSADLRGNTDESWSRATSYLVRNRILTPEGGGAKP